MMRESGEELAMLYLGAYTVDKATAVLRDGLPEGTVVRGDEAASWLGCCGA